MANWSSAATCAAAALSLSVTLASAQTATPPRTTTPSVQSKPAAKLPPGAAANATLTGCLVRDAANGGRPTIESNGISYGLMDKTAAELEQYLGKRVEVTGTLIAAATGARATSGKADDSTVIAGTTTSKNLTATGGQSDITATGTPRDNTVATPPSTEVIPGGTTRPDTPAGAVPLATDRGTTADTTRNVQVKSVRMISPNCL